MQSEHFLYPTNIINMFPASQIEHWTANKNVETFKKGELICTPGQLSDSVYLIIEGHARIFHIHLEGKECVLGILSKGDFIDLLHVFSQKESQLFAKALTEVKLISLTKAEVRNEIQQNKELSTTLLYYFANRLQDTIEVLEQVAYGKVEERLLFLLDKLANKSEKKEDWYPLPEFLTHQNLAGMIASTRETVTLVINKFIQTEKVKQEGQRLWIKKAKN
ncbi:Crp/Fnr family transcriptional regulator [Pseudobacillus badius]|uniref:Crp/Fnr family transcriptional regulator n=1 Tax=Bacillus badius TaxID=1455 RepID=UPI0007B06BA8|nr:Crp/Fnr family transcriptional regulator [Bacillus badius]KZN99075.1 cyclic nucleotide-binding protein [Bacillus badius]OCS84013.1 cyclic nucleotide-binding protein [Bacillus badius]OVE52691.1 cyclic nucleotide-binding protein [Bacillus badius]TDW04706.1 CRP/FNR family transcriptional regulator [Bacillus badius]UAT29147.1 Crp/Fnr family transcriptional regulator [Bacillus badius]